MRISWAIQTAAVFCLFAVHPALAAEENNAATDSISLENAQAAPAVHFFQNFAINPEDEAGDQQQHIPEFALLKREGHYDDNHERPRARPGPSRVNHTDRDHDKDHYPRPGHEPRHRRPTSLPKKHHKKPPCTTTTSK
ncbi:hypothetical protein BGZ83_006003, partial [Gryganskiella cystojenkinii]